MAVVAVGVVVAVVVDGDIAERRRQDSCYLLLLQEYLFLIFLFESLLGYVQQNWFDHLE